MQKRVNTQTGRWKHICRINCDVANTELCWSLSSFSLTHANMAVSNNNRYVWTDEEIKNWNTFLQNSLSIVKLYVARATSCFVSGYLLLLQPCCGMLPIPPSFDKTSVVYPLQPLDGNTSNLPFFFFFLFFCKLSKDLLYVEMETKLLCWSLKASLSAGPECPKLHVKDHYRWRKLCPWLQQPREQRAVLTVSKKNEGWASSFSLTTTHLSFWPGLLSAASFFPLKWSLISGSMQ